MQSTKPRKNSFRQKLLSLLLPLLILQACASALPVVVKPPAVPPPPVVETLPPAGTYWLRLCKLRENVQRELKVTLEPLEPCLALGPSK